MPDIANTDLKLPLPEAFETLRTRAAKLRGDDLEDLVQLHLDPEVSRYLGGVRTPAATAAYLETQLFHWHQHGFGLWALRSADGSFLGRAGLRYVELEGRRELEVAYTLARSAWGQGLASEVVTKLTNLWRAHLSEPSLVGIVEKGNTASEQVLLKAGFSYDRVASFHETRVNVFHQTRELLPGRS